MDFKEKIRYNASMKMTMTWEFAVKSFIFLNRQGKILMTDDPIVDMLIRLNCSKTIIGDMVSGIRDPKKLEPLENKLLEIAIEQDKENEKCQ